MGWEHGLGERAGHVMGFGAEIRFGHEPSLGLGMGRGMGYRFGDWVEGVNMGWRMGFITSLCCIPAGCVSSVAVLQYGCLVLYTSRLCFICCCFAMFRVVCQLAVFYEHFVFLLFCRICAATMRNYIQTPKCAYAAAHSCCIPAGWKLLKSVRVRRTC